MQAIHQYTASAPLTRTNTTSPIQRFFAWCKEQENNRLLWLAIIVAGHGCILTPITVMIITFTGNSMLLWSFALGAMAMSLISNLAAMPVKITMPVFILSLVIDFTIIVVSIASVL